MITKRLSWAQYFYELYYFSVCSYNLFGQKIAPGNLDITATFKTKGKGKQQRTKQM